MRKEVSQFGWKPNVFLDAHMKYKRINMIPKLVITDFDGTLLNDKKNISNKDYKTLEKLRQNKVVVAIATGRSLDSFKDALSGMGLNDPLCPLPIDYILFSTGAGIMDFTTHEILFQRSLPTSDIVQITQYFDKQKIDYMVHKAIPDTNHLLYKSHGQKNQDFHKRLEIYYTHAISLETCEKQFESATQVLAILPGKAGGKIVAKIQQALPDFSVIPATSPLDHQSLWIEVFHEDVSKSMAAAWLCHKLKIDKTDVIAVGNDYNDQDLLAWAGKGFVVGNAPSRLKSHFSTVATNNNSGFSEAVNAAIF